jgi:DNA helicase II / ATP-dependent DNA helicase PcrA
MMNLNDMQQEAVEHINGPLLILAGAGSGKTKVITLRAAYLMRECGVDPWNILAITFTNKAAAEMKERIHKEVGMGAEAIWVATFHSTCVRILRRFIDRLDYDTNFTIYDSDDQKRLMKQIIKKLNLDTKMYKDKALLNEISSAKDELISPVEYKIRAQGNFGMEVKAQVYAEYQKELKKNNALDFDDLIFKTVELLQDHADVLRYYQDRFRYIMVDEYQDTNAAQFELIRLLADKYKNLCVVGDDDQSIYKFRGANIHNILDFEKTYKDAKVIRLEQNYRSTGYILDAANKVIENNKGRKGKTLWTNNSDGNKPIFIRVDTAYDEAKYIAENIRKEAKIGGRSYNDIAVLYRTNAQSRILEERFILSGIPYKIVGGVNFYARKEIKDMISYLKVLDNPSDDLGLRRIINVPKRGIGATSIEKIQLYADMEEISFYEAMVHADRIDSLKRSASKIKPFADFLENLREDAKTESVSDLMQRIIEGTGYVEELEAEDTEEARGRIENIDELLNKIIAYEKETEEPSLSGFLQEVSLVADIDDYDEDQEYVVLMTLHSAKGLEFDCVFLAGMEDGLFPSYMSIMADDQSEVEEERRLCYVGITRAKEKLYMTSAAQRMTHGETHFNPVSRFVKEIPKELLEGYIPKSGYEREAERDRMESSMSMMKGHDPIERTISSSKKKKPYANLYQMKDVPKADRSNLGYDIGDRVKHIKFGEGTVLAIKDGGRDHEVTVEFDGVGTKKMFAGFAKLKKI